MTLTSASPAGRGGGSWFEPAIAAIRGLDSHPDARVRQFLAPDRSLAIGRAPGRLDVMGGIADYSGSLVLELALDLATFAVVQLRDEPAVAVLSLGPGAADTRWFSVGLADLPAAPGDDLAALGRWFADRPREDRWAAYVVGCLWGFLPGDERRRDGPGCRILVVSEVPEGSGVSSSAALEVSSCSALGSAYGVAVGAGELAARCQLVETLVAGAPCGIMDQVTAVMGLRNRLLQLRCQPATVEGHIPVPAGYRFFGIDSGVRHEVSGADYGTVRCAAFMGYRMLAGWRGLAARTVGDRVEVQDGTWRGYLANVRPDEFSREFRWRLPERMLGADFLCLHGGTTDGATRVDPARWYPVRAATAHPVQENARVERFARLLPDLPRDSHAAGELGRLMLDAHASYGACGLGSPETDRLVELVMEAGPGRGLFGARITGGGGGGTVAILARDHARAVVQEVARKYSRETGRGGVVFDGSGPGAQATGVLIPN